MSASLNQETSTTSSLLSFPLPNNPARFVDPESINVLRPILPRPEELLATSASRGGVTETQARRPRTNVTIACDICKQARAKCDGRQSCLRCLKRSLCCKYDHGNDRRRNRGSSEEVQTLTDRLVQYQRFVFALRSSSAGNAGYALQRLRSPSTTEAAFQDPTTSHVVALQLLNEGNPDSLTSMNPEETSALVCWIKADLDTAAAARQASPHPAKELFADHQQGCNGVQARSFSKGDFGLERLLC